jgi:UMF1 family MFS transporter
MAKMVSRNDVRVIEKGDKKTIRGWVMYDWANSVYQLTISSAIFPTYYLAMTSKNADFTVDFFGAKVINSVLYSWAIAASYFIIAILSPLLSSMADYTGRRKGFMRSFTLIGAISCGALFFFNEHNIEFGVIAFALGTLGYCGSIVFYNSFLPIIASPEDLDRISARGYSMGYLGGVVLLVFNLFMILKPTWFFIPEGSSLAARISFITVFIWWIGFSQITFARLPKYTYRKRIVRARIFSNGYKELQAVYNHVRKSRKLKLFLSGFFFVMMGVLTVMFMAVTFGTKELGLGDNVLIPTVLVIQLVGMFGAWLFARLSSRLGNIRALIISITTWILICIGAYFITNTLSFVVAAFFIGIVMGGSQSLARSTYSKMLPEETTNHTSFFSFYDVMEKMATVTGTFSFGLIEAITGNMRFSIIAVAVFFVIGLAFLLPLIERNHLHEKIL